MATQSDDNRGNPSFAATDDPVGQLKLSICKLTEGIQKMGDVLGVVKLEASETVGQQTNSTPNSVKDTRETKAARAAVQNIVEAKGVKNTKELNISPHQVGQQKNAEEIKTQRANKAAEKKARAEAAVAKKVCVGKEKKTQTKSDMNKVKETSENAISTTDELQTNDDVKQTQRAPVGKSALRADGKHTLMREVKFDLSANAVKSPSDESACSEVPIGTCSEVPNQPSTAQIHPAFLNLAVRCEQGMIDEVDSLCLNFLTAFKEFLSDWATQRQKANHDSSSLNHDLDVNIRPQIAHLTQESRWPLPYALGNIVRQLKKQIMKIGATDRSGHSQKLEDVTKWLDDCEEEYFGSAYRAISDYLLGKMRTAPNVITYDWCPLVNKVLLDCVEKDFGAMLTVIDSEMEGRGMRHVQSLVERNIRCRYTDLNSIGAVMKNGSMVLLGCTAVLSNGCVVAPKGSMLVALAAKTFNVPVLVVSQTFKFVDKVQGGGRVALLGRESMELVPSDLITAIVTDIRVLPPSSAPAVLKAKALDLE